MAAAAGQSGRKRRAAVSTTRGPFFLPPDRHQHSPDDLAHPVKRGPKPLQLLKRQPTAWPEMGVVKHDSFTIELDQHRVVTQRGGGIKPMVQDNPRPASGHPLQQVERRSSLENGRREALPQGVLGQPMGPADALVRPDLLRDTIPDVFLPAVHAQRPVDHRQGRRPARAASPDDLLPLVRNLKSAHDRNRPKGRGQACLAGPPARNCTAMQPGQRGRYARPSPTMMGYRQRGLRRAPRRRAGFLK